jgi:hypothetical protein
MIQYVNETSRPIGMINVRDGIDVQFARPRTGQFNRVTVIVYLEGAIGILVEEEGNPTIRTALMPPKLNEAWENASVPPIVKREPVEERVLMVPGRNPVMAQQKRKPMVARLVQEPLVEVPFEEKPVEVKAKKKPPRAVSASLAPARAKKKPPVSQKSAASASASGIPASAKKKPPVGPRP